MREIECEDKNKISVKIHNNTYNVYLVDKNCEYLVMEDGETHSGVTDFATKKIYIRNDLNEDSFRYTLLHELTHAYIESYGLLQVDWNDEIVADFMAHYIKSILRTYYEIMSEINNNEYEPKHMAKDYEEYRPIVDWDFTSEIEVNEHIPRID